MSPAKVQNHYTHRQFHPVSFDAWFRMVKNTATKKGCLTVPYRFLSLPCGCERSAVPDGKRGSTGLFPVDKEFWIRRRSKREDIWVHVGCPGHGTIHP